MQLGNIVKVKTPFDLAFPDTYEVIAVFGNTVTIFGDHDFDVSYLDIVGAGLSPTPAPKVPLTRLEFLRRIPQVKRIGIRSAAVTDPVLADAMSLLDAAQFILTDDSDTQLLIGYCVSLNLLTADEASIILA